MYMSCCSYAAIIIITTFASGCRDVDGFDVQDFKRVCYTLECSNLIAINKILCRYQNSPELRLTWLQYMAEKHISVSLVQLCIIKT